MQMRGPASSTGTSNPQQAVVKYHSSHAALQKLLEFGSRSSSQARRLADLLPPEHLPEFNEAFQPHHLEVIAGHEIEDGGHNVDAVHGVRAKLIAERQRSGREHHGQHHERQVHNPHHQVALDQLSGEWLSKPQASDQSSARRSGLKQHQQRSNEERPTDERPKNEES